MADSGEAAGGERPMRRSRMLSDDARLALQLQDEELKAARGMKRIKPPSAPAAKDAASAVKKPKTEPKKPAASAPAKAAAPAKGGKQTTNSGGAGGKGKASASQASARAAPKTERGATAAKGVPKEASAKSSSTSSQKVPSDSVYFTLEPWPSAQEEVPTLRRSSMTLHEDQTVLSIKRRIVEEAYPGTDVSRVEIRTPTGIKCGQEHSLKYVRGFLWPVSKGDLVMYYCLAPESFL